MSEASEAKPFGAAAEGSAPGLAPASATADRPLATLWRVLSPERARLRLALGALFASSSANLSYPYLLGNLTDLFGGGAAGLELVQDHALSCAGVVLFGAVAAFGRLYLIETSIERVAFRLRHELFGALLAREVAFFDAQKTGELVNRLSNDITVTSRVVVDLSAGIRSSITAVVATGMVFHLAPAELVATLLAPVSLLFVAGVGYGRVVRRISENKQQRLAEAMQLAEERLGGIRVVRTFNAEAAELKRFEGRLDGVYAAGRQHALATAGFSCMVVAGGGLFLLHLIYQCGVLVTSGVVGVGTTVSLAMYSFLAGSSYTGLVAAYGDIQKAFGACQKVLGILEDQSATAGTTPSAPLAPDLGLGEKIGPGVEVAPSLAVRFEGISFFYPSRPDAPVLREVDLDIPAGSRLALLGGSGSGKSTLALLLAGMYAPTAGRVLVDGVDIFAVPWGRAWARQQLGVVPQEPLLFADSVRENVAYGLREAGERSGNACDAHAAEAVHYAVALAHVDEFASRLPDGLDTRVGERGLALSGGQRQRVSIARALARHPRMLIFDEATSSLDMRSEALVHAALRDALTSETRTCLVITHRLSALDWVDRVAVLDEGRVVQEGAKEEVMRNPCGALSALLRSAAH